MAQKMTVTALPMMKTEANVGKVLVKLGDEIKKDQPVVTVETGKGAVELRSTVSGRVTAIHVEDGDVVTIGALLL